MSHLVFGHDGVCLDWLLQRDPEAQSNPDHYALGIIDDDGVLRGCVTITWLSWHCVTLSVEADGVLTRRIIRDVFAFVFEYLGATRCEMVTRKTNKSMKKHAPKTLGFKFEGVRRDWCGPGQDGLAYYMTPQTCKWLTQGQRHENAEAA